MEFEWLSKMLTPKHLLTYSLFFCYFGNAINYSLVGPTLTSLSDIYGVTYDDNMIVTIRTGFYTIGALTGFGYKYVSRQTSLIVSMIIMGITLGVLPSVNSLTIYYVIGAINGITAGSSDMAITAWIIELWDEKSGPYLLAAHFCFGTGNIVGPQIARPFLLENLSQLVFAYIICGIICVISGVILTFVVFGPKIRDQSTTPDETVPNQTHRTSISEDVIQESRRRELRPIFVVIIVIFGCLLLAIYSSMEMSYFNLQSIFAQTSSYNMSEADATLLSSTTYAVYTITRGVEILLALKIPVHYIMLAHFAVIIIFSIVSIVTYSLPLIWLWISNIGIGIGCGSVYPTIYAFLQQNFNIDDKKTAILLFVSGGLGATYPYIVGKSMTSWPLVYIYINIISIILCVLFLFVIRFISWKCGRMVRPVMVMTVSSDGPQENDSSLTRQQST